MKLTEEDINKFRKEMKDILENKAIIRKGRNKYSSVNVYTQKQAERRLNLVFQLTDKELKEKMENIFKELNFTYKEFKEYFK